jgi:hypothetical protein
MDGYTFRLGTPLTLTDHNELGTYQMLTSGSQTYIAFGTSTTIAVTDLDRKDKSSAKSLAALEFTQAPNGNFVLNGTTLSSDRPVTVGSGASRTTLQITTLQHTPAIIIDGTLTRKLGHDEASGFGVASASLAAVTTPPLPSMTTHSVPYQTSSTATSEGARFEVVGKLYGLLLLTVATLFAI